MENKTVVIVGAGPAGLTAAFELLSRSRVHVIVLEASDEIGGISRTVEYHGNRIDIGGHRFFSKSNWVMNWWQEILPIVEAPDKNFEISYHNKRKLITSPNPTSDSEYVMLVRNRLSRIYYQGKFFSYPIKANFDTATKLGPSRIAKIIGSYAKALILPRKPELSLEDFIVNRFGFELYETFFKDYTEKVWGVPCSNISAEWGAQRIKGLNISRAILNALSSPLRQMGLGKPTKNTSLIEHFLYPKYGPGQMWQVVAERVRGMGGEIRLHQKAIATAVNQSRVFSVTSEDMKTGAKTNIRADYVVSTMPVCDLIGGMDGAVPDDVHRIAGGLEFRDFITVGMLLRKLKPTAGGDPTSPINIVPDNWIYIQDNDVKVGRLQFFNNWSPSMVADPGTIWIGLEYFCREGDNLWSLDNSEISKLAGQELSKLGFADFEDILDTVVIRVPKAYPGYFGSYREFGKIKEFVDSIENLFLVGRNGMHRYNNQDHSMLTARYAADSIISGKIDKAAIWAVNVDDDYHEDQEG